MNKFFNYFISILVAAVLLTGAAFGQSENVKTVGIDPSKNTVKVENTKKPFQARVFVTPQGNGFSSGLLPIPAGKRLVIENVSVICRIPEGLKAEVNFYTHMDNDGDGVGGIEDIVFHRIPLTEQGVFDGTVISVFNQKTLVFADSKIGTGEYQLVAQARVNGTVPQGALSQVQFTISGYLEDLPTAP